MCDKSEKWVVDVKVSSCGCSVEVSAVVANSHGQSSYGWHGDEKYIVMRVSSLYQRVPVAESIIDAAIIEAEKVCKLKNKIDSRS